MAPTEDSSNRGRAKPWTGGRDRPRRPVGLNPQTGNYELRLDHPQAVAGPRTPRRPQLRRPPRRRARTAPSADRGRPGAACRASAAPGGERAGGRRRPREPPQAQAAEVAQEEGPAVDRRRMALRARRRRGGGVSLYSTSTATSPVDVGDAGSGGFSKARPINILIIGTDKRTGAGNEGYGDKDSVGHADTTILLPRLQGPHQRDRAVHPARPDHRHPGLPDEAAGRVDEVIPGTQNDPLQHQPRPGRPRPGLHHADRQGAHRHRGRPLHDGRLQRREDADHGGRRREGLPGQGRRRPGLAPEAAGGRAHASRASRPSPSSVPGTASATRATSTGSRSSSSSWAR